MTRAIALTALLLASCGKPAASQDAGGHDDAIYPPSDAAGGSCSDITSDPDNCGACGHACRAGACVAGLCGATTIATGAPLASEAKLVVGGATLYLLDGDELFSVPAAGGTLTDVASAMDVVADAQHVYWSDGSAIWEQPHGGSPSMLVPVSGQFLATDSTHLYFTTASGLSSVDLGTGQTLTLGPTGGPTAVDTDSLYVGSGPRIYKIAKAQGSSETVFVGSLQGAAYDLCVDDQALYAIALPPEAGAWSLTRWSLSDASATEPVSFTLPFDDPKLIEDHGHLFFIQTDAIYRASGAAPFALTVPQLDPVALAADGTHLYWFDGMTGQIDAVAE